MTAPIDDSPISESDVRAMVRLLGDVCALPGGHAERKRFLMDGLRELTGADFWLWGLGIDLRPDTLPTWLIPLHGGFSEDRMAKFMRAQEHPDLIAITAPFIQGILTQGVHITRMRQQTDPTDAFRHSGAYALWREADVAPGILSCRPLGNGALSSVGLYRRMDAPLFTERECRIAHILLTEVPWLHELGLPEDRGVTVPQLSPRQRSVLTLLVQGQSRPAIAAHLRISPHTANDYIKAIYRHFGVHSQAELIARFFRGDGGDAA